MAPLTYNLTIRGHHIASIKFKDQIDPTVIAAEVLRYFDTCTSVCMESNIMTTSAFSSNKWFMATMVLDGTEEDFFGFLEELK